MNSIQKAICNTLLYSSLFNSPLKINELYSKLQISKSISRQIFKINIENLIKIKKITKIKNFFFLSSKPQKCQKRMGKVKISLKKISKLHNLIKKIQNTPFIQNIYLTGSLSVLGSSEFDDFDLLVITSPNRLWITRFLLNLKTDKLNLRRHPQDTNYKDKICFNVFLEENFIKLSSNYQNLYLANEIINAQPLICQKNKYNILINNNLWFKKYLGNSFLNNQNQYHFALIKDFNFTLIPKIIKNIYSENKLFDFLNLILYKLQYLYMKPKITKEKIYFHQAFFHPNNISTQILKTFELEKKQIS